MIAKYHLLVLTLILILANSIKTTTKNQQPTPQPAAVATVSATTTQKAQDKTNENLKNNGKTVQVNPHTSTAANTKAQPSKSTKTTAVHPPSTSSSKATKSVSKTQQVKKTSEVSKTSSAASAVVGEAGSTSSGSNQEADSSKAMHEHQLNQNHSFGVLVVAYFLILTAIAFGVKYVYFPNQRIVQIVLDILIIIVSSIRPPKKGYSPPANHEDVDDANSITVGYTEDHGKQLFWERNSVQGI